MNTQSYDANGSPVEASLTTPAVARVPEPYGDILIKVDDRLIAALDDALIGGMLLPESRIELAIVRLEALKVRRLARMSV